MPVHSINELHSNHDGYGMGKRSDSSGRVFAISTDPVGLVKGGPAAREEAPRRIPGPQHSHHSHLEEGDSHSRERSWRQAYVQHKIQPEPSVKRLNAVARRVVHLVAQTPDAL